MKASKISTKLIPEVEKTEIRLDTKDDCLIILAKSELEAIMAINKALEDNMVDKRAAELEKAEMLVYIADNITSHILPNDKELDISEAEIEAIKNMCHLDGEKNYPSFIAADIISYGYILGFYRGMILAGKAAT